MIDVAWVTKNGAPVFGSHSCVFGPKKGSEDLLLSSSLEDWGLFFFSKHVEHKLYLFVKE